MKTVATANTSLERIRGKCILRGMMRQVDVLTKLYSRVSYLLSKIAIRGFRPCGLTWLKVLPELDKARRLLFLPFWFV